MSAARAYNRRFRSPGEARNDEDILPPQQNPLDLDTRTGWPGDLAYLLARHPREVWTGGRRITNVADDPVFAWAWLDLSRVSERLGESGNAIDEARMAAEAAGGVQHPQAGYFWSQVARIAARNGNDLARAEAATKASLLAPDLKRAQIDGARERLEAGDVASAKGLVELLRAVWPRDLEVLELARRIEGN